MDLKMGPNELYRRSTVGGVQANEKHDPSTQQAAHELSEWKIQEILDEVVEDTPQCRHYYVDIDGEEEPRSVEAVVYGSQDRSTTNSTTKHIDDNEGATKMQQQKGGEDMLIEGEASVGAAGG